MIQIKKTILTLVALLAVTTGAWAQTETLLTTITATGTEQASYSTANMATVSFSTTAQGSSQYLANWGWWGYGWIATVTAAEGYTITKCIFYDDANRTATDSEAPFVVETTEEDKTPRINGTPIDGGNMWSKGIKTIEVYGYVTPAPASGPKVAWDEDKKTGTFTMPGGNVTLEPEYYPQAALTAAPTAINDVPATTDGAIVKAGTVANIGSTETAQGTVMYYVSQTALDDAALLALAADQWTADVPTAEKLTKGEAYVYYYVRGNDSNNDEENFSDGDILAANALTVTIAAEPTYAVTFAEGTDPNEWTASPNTGVTKGTPVTVTYTGSKKVIGVKAEKKAAAPVEVLTYSFDDASHPSGLTAGSRVSFDYSRTSVITNSKFLNAYNNTNGDPDATTVSLGDTDLSGETWTLSFEWAACGGCNSKPDHTTLKAGNATLFDLSGNSNWNTTVTIIYTGSDGSKTLPVPGCDKSNRFTEAVGDQYNTTNYWHHIVVKGSAEGVKMTITNSSTGAAVVEDVVLSETNVNPTSLIIEPCCGGGIGIDALSLTYEE